MQWLMPTMLYTDVDGQCDRIYCASIASCGKKQQILHLATWCTNHGSMELYGHISGSTLCCHEDHRFIKSGPVTLSRQTWLIVSDDNDTTGLDGSIAGLQNRHKLHKNTACHNNNSFNSCWYYRSSVFQNANLFIYYENRTQSTSKKKTNTDRKKDTKIQTHT